MRGSSGRGGYRDSYSTETHRLIWILIGINAAVFILGWFLPDLFLRSRGVNEFTGEPIWDGRKGGLAWSYLQQGEVWRILTYPFIHGSLLHLAVNMLFLWFFGKHFINARGVVQFVIVYAMGSLLGAALQIAVKPNSLIMGASASTTALLAASCWVRANEIFRGLFLFVIPFQMRWQTAALIFLGIDVVMFLATLGRDAEIAWMAHIGGWIYGWAHVVILSGAIRFSVPKPKGRKSKTVPYHRRSENPNIIEAEFSDGKPDHDAVLDKINREGMGSLTDEERRILEQASKTMKGKNPS